MPFEPTPASVSVAPANPTANATAAYLLMGLAVAGATAFTITPQATGRIFVMVVGNVTQSNTATTGTMQLRFGTGTAPVNGAADTGTAAGAQVTLTAATFLGPSPFSLVAIISGLSVPSITPLRQTGTLVPVWLDVAIKSSANSCTITNLFCTAFEL